MKKSLVIIFAALLVLSASLCSCNGNNNGEEESTKGSSIIVESTDENETGEQPTENEESSNQETESEAQSEEVTEKDDEGKPNTEYNFKAQEDLVYIKALNGAVNLRSDTIINDDTVVISLSNDTELQRIAVSEDGEWSRVMYDNQERYIKTVYLTTMEDPNEGFTPVTKTLYLSAKSLTVRIVPSSANEAVGYLYTGDKIDVVAENTELGWYRIKFEGKYIQGEYYISADAKYFSETPVEAE